MDTRCFTGHTETVWDVAVSRDGRRILSGSNDKTVRLWDVASEKQLHCFEGNTGPINAVALSPDGHQGVWGGADGAYGTLQVWDLEQGQKIHTMKGHSSFIDALAISNDGSRLLSGSSDETLRLWDLERGQPIRCFGSFFSHKQGGSVSVVAFSTDGQSALSCGRVIKNATLWNVATGERYGKLVGHTAGIHSAAFFPDGRRAITSDRETVRIWDLMTRQEIPIRDNRTWDHATLHTIYEARKNLPHIDYPLITTFALSPDGQRLLSPYADNLELFEVASGRHLRSFTGHTRAVTSIAFFGDGRRAVSGSNDRSIRTWEL
jgi:WD40 repeat protein